MVSQVNVHEAKSQLSKLIEQVLAGEEVTIARAGKPVVDLVVRHDPFDRMILAQAHVERMRLLTSDQVLLGLGFDWIVYARA